MSDAAESDDDKPVSRRIVSSRHLADGPGWEMSEFEFGLQMAENAFARWVTRCMAAAGRDDLNVLDILILHNVNHRNRRKRVGDLVFVLNLDDAHTVTYALRKLDRAGLVNGERRGKEMFWGTTPKGAALCNAYRDIRRQCLLEGLDGTGLSGAQLRSLASSLRNLSGFYDQASRAAASL